jgi:hypothetical protein
MNIPLITVQVIGWSAIVLSMGSCNANPRSTTNSEDPRVTIEHSNSEQHPTSSSVPLQLVTLDRQEQATTRSIAKNRTNSQAAPVCRVFPCLVLSQDASNPKNRFNNPIYKLTAYRSHTASYEFKLDAVTGRGNTQNRNRYQSNTEAPLPDGSYSVIPTVVKGTIAEVGGTMVPIFPKSGFNPRMRRTALGIHWDPSFDRDPKEDGTSGCIGMTNRKDYQLVRDFILKYHPRSLEVRISS